MIIDSARKPSNLVGFRARRLIMDRGSLIAS
jgi:hypothetical protein